MMTNGPAATIGEILDVPFPRPRRREAILARAGLLLAARRDPRLPGGAGPHARRLTRRVARTLCPYCGVGCGLLVQVEGGAVAPREGRSRPSRQLRRRLRQGRAPAADAARAGPPALSRRCARAAAPSSRACRGTRRCGAPAERLARDRRRARAGRRRRSTAPGQLLTEEYYVAAQARQGLHRHQQLRHQLAPLHGLGRRRLHALVRRRRPARRLRGPRAGRLLLPHRHQHGRLPPDRCSSASVRRKLAAPDDVTVIVADPRWTETADLADLHLPLRPGSDIALLNGMLHVLWREGLLDGRFIDAHTVGLGGAARRDRALSAGARGGAHRARRPTSIVAAARRFGAGPRRRSRSGAWGSTRATSARTRTRRSSTCISRPGRSAGPARGRSRSPASRTRWAGARPAASSHLLPGYRSRGRPGGARRGRAALGRRRRARSRPRRGAPRSRSSRAWRPATCARVWIIVHQPGRLDARPRPRRAGAAPGRAGRSSRTPITRRRPRASPTCCCRPPSGRRRTAS